MANCITQFFCRVFLREQGVVLSNHPDGHGEWDLYSKKPQELRYYACVAEGTRTECHPPTPATLPPTEAPTPPPTEAPTPPPTEAPTPLPTEAPTPPPTEAPTPPPTEAPTPPPTEAPTPPPCDEEKGLFADLGLPISNPTIDAECHIAPKQCGDDGICYCIQEKQKKKRKVLSVLYKKMEIPESEDYYTCQYKPKRCLKALFKYIVKEQKGKNVDGYKPQCESKKNQKDYLPKQCNEKTGNCRCVKAKGGVRKKPAEGPVDTINCN